MTPTTYRAPLPKEMYDRLCDHAKQGLEQIKANPLNYLEELVSNAANNNAAAYVQPDFKQICDEMNEDPTASVRFSVTVLLRYLQLTHQPIRYVQILTDFDTPEGNQVDMFLERFFGLKI